MCENNKFRSYRKDHNEYWWCTINGCTARLKTSNGSELVDFIMISNNHTHALDAVVNETVQAENRGDIRVDFILMWLLPCVFIHFSRAVSYITQMRFHHQLMRFYKTARDTPRLSSAVVARTLGSHDDCQVAVGSVSLHCRWLLRSLVQRTNSTPRQPLGLQTFTKLDRPLHHRLMSFIHSFIHLLYMKPT